MPQPTAVTSQGRLALVCGSPQMVRHTVSRLRAGGIAQTDVRFEQFATLDEDSHAVHHHTHDAAAVLAAARRIAAAQRTGGPRMMQNETELRQPRSYDRHGA